MIRLVAYIVVSLALALGLAWLISQEGTVTLEVSGYRLQPGVGVTALALVVVISLAVLLWSLVRRLLAAPAILAQKASARRRQRGVEALSDGFIALQGGDAGRARQLALEARAKLPGNAAAQLLQARADLALNEWGAAREQYRALLENPKTAVAALSGLYQQARAQQRHDAAVTFAHKAHALAPTLGWAARALLEDVIQRSDWEAALEMVNNRPAATRQDKIDLKRHSAVLHTALAVELETTNPLGALEHARTAMKLEPDFVPAALIAARIYSSRAEVRKATSLLRRVWRASKHPHVATLFANAQPGISPAERLKRLGELVPSPPPDRQSAIVVANSAIEAQEWASARNALAKYAPVNPSQAVCVAMAKIEEGQNADYGRARQWLARAVTAQRDPTWTADGVTAGEWAPVSPVSGQLDAFEWKVPTNAIAIDPAQEEDSSDPLAIIPPAKAGKDSEQTPPPLPPDTP